MTPRAPLVAVIAAASLAYVTTAARTVLGGDNGEFATLLVTGGAAHPPGYPLYVLYLQAFRWLPASSPAHAAALATALLGALSVAALARACIAWGASIASTGIATAVYAFSSLAWVLATHAEVFAMNALFAAMLLWLSSPAPPLRSASLAVALALLAGLALSNHQTIVALAPVGLWAALHAVRAARSRPLAVALALAAFVIGLSPYAYVWFAAQHADDLTRWTWGGVHDLPSFYAFFRRGQYPDAQLSSAEHITALLWRVTTELSGLPLFALLAALVWIARRRGARGTRAVKRAVLLSAVPLALLALSFVLAGPGFALLFNLPLHGIGHAVTERFYLLPMLILTVLGARGLDALLAAVLGRREVALAAMAVAGVGSAVVAWPHVRAHHRPYVEQYVINALRSAPPNAVLMGSGDQRFGAFLYARYALGMRPDVTFVSPRMLLAPWYHARIEASIGVPLVAPVDRKLDMTAFVRELLRRSKRPVALTNSFLPEAIVQRFPSYAHGTLIVLPRLISEIPAPPALEAENLTLYATFAHEIDPPRFSTEWIQDLAPDYARVWLSLEGAYHHIGDDAAAQRAEQNRARASLYEAGPLWNEP